MENEQLVVRSW